MEWQVTDAYFKGHRFHVATPDGSSSGITSQEIKNERRLQVSEKPMLDGGEIEDFGRKARMFSAEVIFFGKDYRDDLKAFEKILDEGTTGILVLPDLDEAVNAKYQQHSRRSSASDGATTILSVSWIEDTINKASPKDALPLATAVAAAQAGDLASAIPKIQSQTSAVLAFAQSAQSALNNNSVLNQIKAAQSAVVATTTTINSVLNIPRNLRQTILSTLASGKLAYSGLQAALGGLQNFSSLLSLSLQDAAPAANSGLGAIDFVATDLPVTTLVQAGTSLVVTAPVVTPSTVQSLPEAQTQLSTQLAAIQQSRKDLESQTGGATADYSVASLQTEVALQDLIALLTPAPSRQVLTVSETTLLEVCFNNGLAVKDIDRVYHLNTFLDDIMAVPPFSVISL